MKKKIPTKTLYSRLFSELCLDDEKLSRLHEALLSMMVDFDAACRKHGLTYYMSGGTLLGAVRHSGFIPWDDDIDVVMPREDYDRLPAIMAAEYPDKYLVKSGFSTKTDPTANHKIYLLGSEYRELHSAQRDKPHMIFLDVFCLQSVSARPLSRKIRGAFADAAMLGAILKAEYSAPTKMLTELAKTDAELRAHLRPRRALGFFANLMPMRFYYWLNRAILKRGGNFTETEAAAVRYHTRINIGRRFFIDFQFVLERIVKRRYHFTSRRTMFFHPFIIAVSVDGDMVVKLNNFLAKTEFLVGNSLCRARI